MDRSTDGSHEGMRNGWQGGRVKIKRIIGGLAALVALTGCGAGATAPEELEELAGSWRWLNAVGGIAGQTRTPASTGETMTLRFLEGDSVELKRNGELAVATVSADTLILVDPCCDGFTYRFLREP